MVFQQRRSGLKTQHDCVGIAAHECLCSLHQPAQLLCTLIFIAPLLHHLTRCRRSSHKLNTNVLFALSASHIEICSSDFANGISVSVGPRGIAIAIRNAVGSFVLIRLIFISPMQCSLSYRPYRRAMNETSWFYVN